jgi:hypothetical protein
MKPASLTKIQRFIDDPRENYFELVLAFTWSDTEQGYDYWNKIFDEARGNSNFELSEEQIEALIQLTKPAA